MRQLLTLFLIGSLLALLAACGSASAPPTAAPIATVAPATATAAPTATVAPTATAAPTATIPPTATVAPTATPTAVSTAVIPAGGTAVTDSSGKCQLTLAPVFKASGASKDTYATADNLALVTFTGTDTPGLALGAATEAFIGGFQSVVTGYAETGRQTTKDARGDVQVVTFDGAVSGQQAKGVFYFVQNGGVLCALVALAIPPGDTRYQSDLQAAAVSLKVIKPNTSYKPR